MSNEEMTERLIKTIRVCIKNIDDAEKEAEKEIGEI